MGGRMPPRNLAYRAEDVLPPKRQRLPRNSMSRTGASLFSQSVPKIEGRPGGADAPSPY